MRFTDKIIFLVIFIAIVSGYFYYQGDLEFDYFNKDLTARECSDLGGEIVNSLNSECEGEKLGEISDLTCPCVCCEKE